MGYISYRCGKERVAKILKDDKITAPFVVLHPGARIPLKRWFTEKYAMLYDKLIDRFNIHPVIAASKDDATLVGEIVSQMTHKVANLTGRLNIREFAWVLKQSQLFICNDSAPLHVASAMKLPTVAIFGPSKALKPVHTETFTVWLKKLSFSVALAVMRAPVTLVNTMPV